MENPETGRDPVEEHFDAWLQRTAVKPPADMLARVRARIADPDSELERVIDHFLKPDPSLANPRMSWLVRGRLSTAAAKPAKPAWFNWLVPLAAAATLAVAFLSFQNRAPQPALRIAHASTADSSVAEDTQMAEIFALATNLHGSADMTKLESVEALAFLFD